jgi:hypothetical protein
MDASEEPHSRWKASMAKVELQDTANAVCRLVVPRCSLLSLWKVRPPIVTRLVGRAELPGLIRKSVEREAGIG